MSSNEKKQTDDSPVSVTQNGIVIKWKTVLIYGGVLLGISGGAPALTTYLGWGSSVSAEQMKEHEKAQERIIESFDGRTSKCELSIEMLAKTLRAVEMVQRMQVATIEARNITSKIKNVEERENQFVRILQLNLKRLSSDPPGETCYSVDCTN